MQRSTMTATPQTRRNRTDNADSQLRLFLSTPDRSDIQEPGYERTKKQKSLEGMQERNRAACVQQFVVKKHRATRLHYDFRLGWNRVLISWAIPDGPSYCPSHSRKAIEVRDHRKEYLGFEGVLPAGKPGAGPTMLWDWGIWMPQPRYFDVDEALRNGELGFTLYGEKLKGNWMLCRTGGKTFGDDPIWMLAKASRAHLQPIETNLLWPERASL